MRVLFALALLAVLAACAGYPNLPPSARASCPTDQGDNCATIDK